MTALRELREKVAAGEFPAYMSNRDLGWDVAILTPYEAFSGSLDAAKALHEALLPGWKYLIRTSDDRDILVHGCQLGDFFVNIWPSISPNEGGAHFSLWAKPASRAWLLAILDALITKETDDVPTR